MQRGPTHSAPEDAAGQVRTGGRRRGSPPGPEAEEDPGGEPAGAAETQLRGGPRGPAGGPGIRQVSVSISTHLEWTCLSGDVIKFMLLCANSLLASLLLASFR